MQRKVLVRIIFGSLASPRCCPAEGDVQVVRQAVKNPLFTAYNAV